MSVSQRFCRFSSPVWIFHILPALAWVFSRGWTFFYQHVWQLWLLKDHQYSLFTLYYFLFLFWNQNTLEAEQLEWTVFHIGGSTISEDSRCTPPKKINPALHWHLLAVEVNLSAQTSSFQTNFSKIILFKMDTVVLFCCRGGGCSGHLYFHT